MSAKRLEPSYLLVRILGDSWGFLRILGDPAEVVVDFLRNPGMITQMSADSWGFLGILGDSWGFLGILGDSWGSC